jgi:hypothetical protein
VSKILTDSFLLLFGKACFDELFDNEMTEGVRVEQVVLEEMEEQADREVRETVEQDEWVLLVVRVVPVVR